MVEFEKHTIKTRNSEHTIDYINLGSIFNIVYGYVGGAVVKIPKHLLLDKLKGQLTDKELNSLKYSKLP